MNSESYKGYLGMVRIGREMF